MNILCFDTVLNKTFITLVVNGVFRSKTIESDEKNYHSVYLISEIKNLLAENNTTMEDIEAIGVNVGPGSFTGIRVCLTVASTMANQLDVPLVGVPSVEILSAAVGTNTAVFLDARRNSYVYYDGTSVRLIEKPAALEFAHTHKRHKKIITDTNCFEYFKENGIEAINYETENLPLGEILAAITVEKLSASKNPSGEFHPSKIKPLYLQTPPIMQK